MSKKEPVLGDEIVIKGTGRRWSGVHFPVTIVDVNDTTFKVRYNDGGYKRFDKSEYNNLIINAKLENTFEAYELFDDMYDPTAEATEKASKLREEMKEAVKKHDFNKANVIKQEIQAKLQVAEKLHSKRHQMMIAVQNEDFVKAQQFKEELDTMTKALPQEQVKAAEKEVKKKQEDIGVIIKKSAERALGGGLAGASAMAIQVSSLMWMRTAMNYQYRYGGTFKQALTKLYAEGGILRFYKGFTPALVQGPLSRFGDTASNTGVLALLNSYPETASLPVQIKTLGASAFAAGFRIFLMPVDSLKTGLQVDGSLAPLMQKIKKGGPTALYAGSLGAAAATFMGHYPWWATYNTLDGIVPQQPSMAGTLLRSAGMGFVSSVVSDTTSNSMRVVKTVKQTSPEVISYPETVKLIIAQDGVKGLFLRGLGTRLLSNAAQGVMFSVLWKYIDKTFFSEKK